MVDPDVLQSVTPDARHKNPTSSLSMPWVFAKTKRQRPSQWIAKPSVPLDKILNLVAAGAASDEIVSTLASRLSRLDQEVDPIQQAAIQKASGGKTLAELSAGLLKSIDADGKRRSGVPAAFIPYMRRTQLLRRERTDFVSRWQSSALATGWSDLLRNISHGRQYPARKAPTVDGRTRRLVARKPRTTLPRTEKRILDVISQSEFTIGWTQGMESVCSKSSVFDRLW